VSAGKSWLKPWTVLPKGPFGNKKKKWPSRRGRQRAPAWGIGKKYLQQTKNFSLQKMKPVESNEKTPIPEGGVKRSSREGKEEPGECQDKPGGGLVIIRRRGLSKGRSGGCKIWRIPAGHRRGRKGSWGKHKNLGIKKQKLKR